MAGRRCVYTVVVGGYEEVLEQHVARHHDTDLILFTDAPVPASSAWEVRPVEPRFPADASRSSRYPKLFPHLVLPEYDESLFIDNNVLLTVDPAVMFDEFLPEGVGMAGFAHSFRATIRDEFEEVVKVSKESPWVCAEQLAHYEATDPEALDLRPIAGGFLFRRHADPLVQRTMERWWEHVLRYSRRDQLSLRIAARAEGLDILVHEVDNHLSPYHEWPRQARRAASGTVAGPLGPDDHIRALEAEVEELRATACELEHQLDVERHQRNLALIAQEGALRAEIAESVSWRVTRPLRAAGHVIRRLRRRRSG